MWSTGINRNIVECKVKTVLIEGYMEKGINRNIVECKEIFQCFRFTCKHRINRNIVECKDVSGKPCLILLSLY